MKNEFDTIKNMITCFYCGEIFKKDTSKNTQLLSNRLEIFFLRYIEYLL